MGRNTNDDESSGAEKRPQEKKLLERFRELLSGKGLAAVTVEQQVGWARLCVG